MAQGQASGSVVTRMSIMMFLQFFVWGAWFTTLGACLAGNGLGDIIGGAYGTAPLAAIFAPLFLAIVADRFFASEKVMGVLFLVGGGLLCAVPTLAADPENAKLIYMLFLGHMLCYMPTLGLSNSIVFANVSDAAAFPKVRVWGTIGWIVAGLLNGFMGWSVSLMMFYVGGVAALALGVFCFALPNTPPPAKGQPLNLRAIFMVDALSLLRRPAFAVFAICSTLICIPLAYYYGVTSQYLTQTGFVEAASAMSIGQMSEIFFMLLIPFFFRKLGVKWMILIGMLAWLSRYLLFAYGAPDQVVWMLLLAVALHGICYDFFFVTGFIYTENSADESIRNQAQGLLVFLTQGVGMFFGYKVAFGAYTPPGPPDAALAAAIGEARPQNVISFGEQLTKLFSVNMPETVDPVLLSETMAAWKVFWMWPAAMAGVIAVVFFLAFWDRGDGSKKSAVDSDADLENSNADTPA